MYYTGVFNLEIVGEIKGITKYDTDGMGFKVTLLNGFYFELVVKDRKIFEQWCKKLEIGKTIRVKIEELHA